MQSTWSRKFGFELVEEVLCPCKTLLEWAGEGRQQLHRIGLVVEWNLEAKSEKAMPCRSRSLVIARLRAFTFCEECPPMANGVQRLWTDVVIMSRRS